MFFSNVFRSYIKGPLFSIPSVMEATTFVSYVKRRTELLKVDVEKELLQKSLHLDSAALREEIKQTALQKCAPLLDLNVKSVEEFVFKKYDLYSERIPICLVPYRVAVNLILKLIPAELRPSFLEELAKDEQCRKNGVPLEKKRYIEWREEDIYTSTGLGFLKKFNEKKPRTPVLCIMGHINHGKTSLIDALQSSQVLDAEASNITQSLRVFTRCHPQYPSEQYTFIDTPGHRMFVESRFHSILLCDFVILVISVVEGIQGQVHEIIKTALNVDRPIIVVFNKLDLFSDPFSAHDAVGKCINELEAIGLEVTVVHQEKKDVDKNDPASEVVVSESFHSLSTISRKDVFFEKMKVVDPNYKGSRKHPVVDLKRKCLGVCISAKMGININLLWEVIRECKLSSPPMCYNTSPRYDEQNATVQAVVLESSKHLFDEEGFRGNAFKQKLQGTLDGKIRRKQNRFDKNSPLTKSRSTSFAVEKYLRKHNRSSTPCLVITAIVREGAITRGMPFVADQAEGKVDVLMDYWGNPLTRATPGMSVTIVDFHSISGCPGIGVHVLSTKDDSTRFRIYNYRRILQWYVEVFTSRLDLLRPREMDVSFAHLGDYGQLKNHTTLEYQLLYGPPPGTSPELVSLPGSQQPLYAYLAEKNSETDALAPRGTDPFSRDGTALTTTKRVDQDLFSKNENEVLENTWKSLRPSHAINSEEEYRKHISQCIQLGVLLKVDSWHSARMIMREVPRLGTKKVHLDVVGTRFGSLVTEDITSFGNAVKIAVCYRVPLVDSVEVDQYLEAADWWVLQTDHIEDLMTFLKWCVVSTHKENVKDEETRRFVELKQNKANSSSQQPPTQNKKLLKYTPIHEEDL